jgi:phosphopantothenoylcysteine decarboxylase/phosphopantothenate--cysteine ligase
MHLGSIKKDHILVGFALETNDEEKNAKSKLKRKNLDFIILNSLNDQGAGFKTDTNKITLITNSETIRFKTKPKSEVAKDIFDHILKLTLR